MTTQTEEPTRKIVSRGKYAQIQGMRAGIGIAGFCMLLAAATCLIVTLLFCIMALTSLFGSNHSGPDIGATFVMGALIGGGLTFLLANTGMAAITITDKLNNVVPLTKPMAADLPAQESLVRASAEPRATPETVLLRAASENPTTPPEQLVRSCSTPE